MFRFAKNKKQLRSDKELLWLYRKTGNLEFMGELYDRYTYMIYGTCLKYLKNREESKDAVMLIFEKILIELRDREIKNFPGWIYVVTRNFCLMQLRRAGKIKDIDQFEENTLNIFMESNQDTHPDDSMEIETETEALKKCLDELSKHQKQCISLFYYEDKCYDEITNITGYDLKKVKSYLQNGKRNLKNCLNKQNVRKKESS
jgi:RNA polymerase sigma-70 factor (ECF subfamily)